MTNLTFWYSYYFISDYIPNQLEDACLQYGLGENAQCYVSIQSRDNTRLGSWIGTLSSGLFENVMYGKHEIDFTIDVVNELGLIFN